MGRQIPIIATSKDEEAFLTFLRDTAPIVIFESVAPTIDGLRVDRFSSAKDGHLQYHIWNQSFPWRPVYGQVNEGESKGWYFISNGGSAPILEFTRSGQSPGRIYWAKHFSAPDGLRYDVGGFEKWFNKIIRWTKKRATHIRRGSAEAYVLADAVTTSGGDPNKLLPDLKPIPKAEALRGLGLPPNYKSPSAGP
jgi:hypothetical protein